MAAEANRRLLTGATRLAETGDRLGRRFARQLGRALRDLERELARLPWPEDLRSLGSARAVEAMRLRQQVRDALTRSGYRELVQAATEAPFDRMATLTRALRQPGIETADVGLRVEALRELHRLDLFEDGARMGDELATAVTRAAVAGAPRAAMLNSLSDQVDRWDPRLATLYDTALSVYGREVEAIASGQDPGALFVYVGPVDAKTRRFCQRWAGRVLKRREIDKLDNRQLPEPFLTAGGYNCRHTWVEISAASDLAKLHKTRRRMPEVKDDLRRLKATRG